MNSAVRFRSDLHSLWRGIGNHDSIKEVFYNCYNIFLRVIYPHLKSCSSVEMTKSIFIWWKTASLRFHTMWKTKLRKCCANYGISPDVTSILWMLIGTVVSPGKKTETSSMISSALKTIGLEILTPQCVHVMQRPSE